MATAAEKRLSRSLVYGLGMLRHFSAEHPVRSVSELAELLQVSRPTAHRYASTCLDLGYLEQAPMRRYRLARKAADVGVAMLSSLQLTRLADPVLRELREVAGRTVSLAVLDEREVVYLRRLRGFERGDYRLEQHVAAGSRRPASSTAAGLAMLATPGAAAGGACADDVHVHEEPAARGHARARSAAIAVRVDGWRTSALELTAPASAISEARLLALHSGQLLKGAEALRATLEEETSDPGPAEPTH